MTRTATIEANPNPIPIPSRQPARTTLTWKAEGADAVEVRINAPDGPLFSRSGPSGRAATGEWVTDGMTFFLQDVTDGRSLTPENTLDRVAVHLVPVADLDEAGASELSEKLRLESLARYQPATTTLLGEPVQILDGFSFLQMYREIVEEGLYFFPTRTPNPYIIDGGANIGVSVLYFKSTYPGARIVAFEPDDEAFARLRENVHSRGYQGITLVHRALAATDGHASFIREGSYASRIARGPEAGAIQVPAARLRPYLEGTIDLLKLNIEGAETDVLVDCADLLHRVDRIVLEFHSLIDEPQTLHRLLRILADADYRVYVRSVGNAWRAQPFAGLSTQSGMDFQLYVYAFRNQH